MKIKKEQKFTQIIPTELIEEFLIQLKEYSSKFNKEHLIIDFSEKININIKELNLFLNLAEAYRKNQTSLVIICNNIDIDEIPDEINVVPTFTEAIDVLEMEAIERDLGF